MSPDPIPLAQALIRRASVTPVDAGVLEVAVQALTRLGFACRRYKFGEVDNLYARLGGSEPVFCFAGHLDVVPVGDEAAWTQGPFEGGVEDGWLRGRGAADMKAAIAAMIAGVEGFVADGPPPGSIAFLLTLDEEGPAVDGTKKVLEALATEGETLSHCLVGEPTSVADVGDIVKNGRRGSLNAVVAAVGKQGHVAYPALACNPMGPLLDFLQAARSRRLDDGSPGFDPSNLEVTTIDVGNTAHNVIAARAAAKLNIRFNMNHSGASLTAWLQELRAKAEAAHPGASLSLDIKVTAEPFYSAPGELSEIVLGAIAEITGRQGALSTTGGTSDARFIRHACPVIELGMQNETSHMVNEKVRVDDVRTLARIYEAVLRRYFSR